MFTLFFFVFKELARADNATDTPATTTTTGATGAPCGTSVDNGQPLYIDVCGVCGGWGNCTVCEYGIGMPFTDCPLPDINDRNMITSALVFQRQSSAVVDACTRVASYEKCVALKYGNKCLQRAIMLGTGGDCRNPAALAAIGCGFVCDESALAAPGAGGGINAGLSMRTGGASLLLPMIAALFFAK